jgi:imidazolonepropionase-like amidohydrolase
MSRAGMTFPQILASLTTAPASRFSTAKNLGRIAPGFQADLAVFQKDPAANLQALSLLKYTFRAGEIIYRAID